MKQWRLLAVAMLGLLGVGCSAGPLGALARGDDDEGAVEVKLEDCPKAVQDTIKQEAGSGKIEEIEKETENGRTLYEAEVVIGGKTYELTVGEDGTLIGKEAEEDDEDGEDDD